MEQKQPQAQIAVDPNLATEQQQAQNTLVAGLQTQAQMDTADMMTRYGTKLALSSAGMSAGAPDPAPPVPSIFGAGFGIRAA